MELVTIGNVQFLDNYQPPRPLYRNELILGTVLHPETHHIQLWLSTTGVDIHHTAAFQRPEEMDRIMSLLRTNYRAACLAFDHAGSALGEVLSSSGTAIPRPLPAAEAQRIILTLFSDISLLEPKRSRPFDNPARFTRYIKDRDHPITKHSANPTLAGGPKRHSDPTLAGGSEHSARTLPGRSERYPSPTLTGGSDLQHSVSLISTRPHTFVVGEMPLEGPELVESFLHLVEAVFIDKIIPDGAFQITGKSFILYSIFPVHQFEMGTSDEAVVSQFVNPENHIAYDVHFNDYTGMAQGWITFNGLDATQLFAMDSIESARTYMNDLYQEVMSKELDADQMLALLSNTSYVNRLAPVPYYQALQNLLNIHGRGKGKKFICIPASTADVEDPGRAKMFG